MLKWLCDSDASYIWAQRLLCLIVIAFTCLVLFGCGAKADEQITADAVRVADEKKITFTFPLEYSASVTQCKPKEGCKTRFYSRSTK